MLNRSPDPVYAVRLQFETRSITGDAATSEILRYDTFGVTDLAPCTELIYGVRSHLESGAKGGAEPLGETSPAVTALKFTDRTGKPWVRTPEELSPWPPADETPPANGRPYRPFLYDGEPKTRTVETCGS